jgi:pimeloyl-ACP methyl ester carboxylesterase
MEWLVQTDDGRTLSVEDVGDPDGRPVMVHVGTPNSRHLYGRAVADAAARGLRLISYDRPGYGESTPRPGRTMADATADARAICAALGIGRLAMWGLSGGGPLLLALRRLAARPGRCGRLPGFPGPVRRGRLGLAGGHEPGGRQGRRLDVGGQGGVPRRV